MITLPNGKTADTQAYVKRKTPVSDHVHGPCEPCCFLLEQLNVEPDFRFMQQKACLYWEHTSKVVYRHEPNGLKRVGGRGEFNCFHTGMALRAAWKQQQQQLVRAHAHSRANEAAESHMCGFWVSFPQGLALFLYVSSYLFCIQHQRWPSGQLPASALGPGGHG